MGFDLLVKSAKIVSSQGVAEGSLLVCSGKVAAILAPGYDLDGVDVAHAIDATGLLAVPGMVDLHVHIGEPGKTDKEDIVTGTSAAAAGGVTTAVIMPNCVPPVNSRESLIARADLFRRKSLVDFALLGGAGGESLDQIVEQADAGAVGYKSYVGAYREERRGLICQGTGDIYEVLSRVRETGRFVGYHCEDSGIIGRRVHHLVSQGRVDFRAYHESRPEFTEVLSTLPLMEVALQVGARLYLVHISSPRTLEFAELWREEGADVTIETCPHYLLFDEEDTARLGPYAVVAPPLRSRETVQRLWDVLNEGLIDTIATDHAPGTPEERALGQKNIFKAGGGLPALETVWPTLMNEVNKGRLTLEKLVFLLAENPARVARLYPRKGCLSPGSDADIVLMDQHEVHRLRAGEMYTKHTDAATIFDGMEVKGRVKAVLQRGRVISRDGRLVSDRPSPAMWIRS